MSQFTLPFPLTNLPPELQDEIWTLTLRTTPNIFHVAASSPSPTDPTKHRLTFHHNHPTPPAVLVCRQARAAARRAGFVPVPQPSDAAPPIWLNARHDILFLDSHTARLLLSHSPEAPQLSLVPALHNIRNIAFEQGTFPPNRHLPIETYEGSVVRDFMALLVPVLLEAAPHFEELHYFAPIVWDWDHELRSVNVLDCVLSPLNQNLEVWAWRGSPRRSWAQVRSEFVAALEALDISRVPPVLKGWRLIRQHPLGPCHGDIVRRMSSLQVS